MNERQRIESAVERIQLQSVSVLSDGRLFYMRGNAPFWLGDYFVTDIFSFDLLMDSTDEESGHC